MRDFRIIPHLKYNHLIPATVEADGDYAYLNEKGDYHLRLSYDQDNPPQNASCPITAAQATAGLHFPLRRQTKAILGLQQGNIDKPYILGALPSSEHSNPVTCGNYSQNIICTPAGNELNIEDTASNQQLKIATKDYLNILHLDANDKTPHTSLTSKQGALQKQIAQNTAITTNNNHNETAEQNHKSTISGDKQLQTKNEDIQQQTGKDITYQAQAIEQKLPNIELNTPQNIQKTAEKSLQHINETANWRNKNKQLQLTGDKNQTMHGSKTADIYFGNHEGLTITTHQQNGFAADNVTLNANTINMHQDVAINTTLSLSTLAAINNPQPEEQSAPQQNKTKQQQKQTQTGSSPTTNSPAGATTIQIKYQEDATPQAGAYYTITFANGMQRQGQLDNKGTARLEGVPATDYTVTYSTKSQQDSQKENLKQETNQLKQQRAQLKQHLDQMLKQLQSQSREAKIIYDNASILQKQFLLDKAVLQGAWQALKQTAKGMLDLIKTGAKIAIDVKLAELGKPSLALQETKTTAQEAKAFWYILSDEQTCNMLAEFAQQYWAELDVPDKYKTISDITSLILIALLTRKTPLPALTDTSTASEDLTSIAETLETINSWQQDEGVAGESLTTTRRPKNIDVTEEAKTKTDDFGITDDTEVMRQREKRARKFYKEQGASKRVIDEEVPGIDFTKPVEIETIPVGTKLQQWQIPQAEQGRYYCEIGETPTRVGINPQAKYDPPTVAIVKNPSDVGKIFSKVPVVYETTQEIEMLKTFAQPDFIDTWSIPEQPYTTEGGGIQYFSANKSAFKKIN